MEDFFNVDKISYLFSQELIIIYLWTEGKEIFPKFEWNMNLEVENDFVF